MFATYSLKHIREFACKSYEEYFISLSYKIKKFACKGFIM